jgi:hypothetical protein
MADHETAFGRVKELFAHAVTLAHPKQDYYLCLFTDVSDSHWGKISARVLKKQLKVSMHDQGHEPLAS